MRLIKRKLMLYVHDFNPRTPCGMRRNIKLLQTAILHFNPRTPCGMRPMSKIQFSKVMIFQSTHPLRDATDQLDLLGGLMDISIHAPLAGCDAERPVVCIGAGGISIHAPLAGCDSFGQKYYDTYAGFQSTHPLRDATASCS